MFQKPFRVKSNSSIKGSDRKKLRAHLEKHYSSLSPEQLQELVPSKAEMSQMKLFTHGGQSVTVYILESNPVFFEAETHVFPTVYTLWKYPGLLPVMVTWPPVFEKLLGGADLMQPGVVLRGDTSSLEKLSVNDVVSVRIVGNMSPLSVGLSFINHEKLFGYDRKGKAVKIMHTFGDQLWLIGTKSEPPLIEENTVVHQVDDSDSKEDDNDSCDDEKSCEVKPELEEDLTKVEERLEQVVITPCEDEELEVTSVPSKSETELMDELLLNCFLRALKTKMKTVELPLLTSTFYSAYMLPSCTGSRTLDVKKSSYKKFSVFLKGMQSQGFLEVKELQKGIESIVAINCEHKQVRMCKFKPDLEEVEAAQSSEKPACYSPPEIEDLFVVGAAVIPFFKTINIGKGCTFSSGEVRKMLTDYVKKENLQSPTNLRQVVLDPILSDTLLNKAEYLEQLSWEDLHSRCLARMQPGYKITFPNHQPMVKKGHIQPIEIAVAQRTGNKKVTLVYNLETYGIDPEAFAHEVQVGVAASTSVGAAQSKKGIQVLVQGNQTAFISKLLLQKYCLPKKFITGLEKITSKKKK